jgi:hypothetical protein
MTDYISSIFNNQVTGLPKDSEEFAKVIIEAYALSRKFGSCPVDMSLDSVHILDMLRKYESESYGAARNHIFRLRQDLEKGLAKSNQAAGSGFGAIHDFRQRPDYIASLFPNEESGD